MVSVKSNFELMEYPALNAGPQSFQIAARPDNIFISNLAAAFCEYNTSRVENLLQFPTTFPRQTLKGKPN
jgi:hypothetical protein